MFNRRSTARKQKLRVIFAELPGRLRGDVAAWVVVSTCRHPWLKSFCELLVHSRLWNSWHFGFGHFVAFGGWGAWGIRATSPVMLRLRSLVFTCLCSTFMAVGGHAGEPFEVVVYNVENLFDADGVSLFKDYREPRYTAGHLAAKLRAVSAVIRQYGDGSGPEIIFFSEFEADQTAPRGARVLLVPESWSGSTAQELLSATELSDDSRDAASVAWVFKQLEDDGLGRYEVAIGDYEPDVSRAIGDIAHVNAVFSKFPILASQTHQTLGARGILEVTVDVDGHPLHLFVNHWKSGASNPDTESLRIGNAGVLRRRINEILRNDPRADIILGGDFNSHYNQKARNPHMPRTAMDDILGSQGDELALQEEGGPDLYNLWFEIPNERRGSDTWNDEWGTLMQILVTPGLYDTRGIQYVDNSFAVGRFPGLNADPATGQPVRWYFAEGGGGYSDHFPVSASFRVAMEESPNEWIALDDPSRTPEGPATGVPVIVSPDFVTVLSGWPEGEPFPAASLIGQYYEVKGTVKSKRPFIVSIDHPRGEFGIWIYHRGTREKFFSRFQPGQRIGFVGQLGQYRGNWQFVIPRSEAGER